MRISFSLADFFKHAFTLPNSQVGGLILIVRWLHNDDDLGEGSSVHMSILLQLFPKAAGCTQQ
jgi:hypothetical protein